MAGSSSGSGGSQGGGSGSEQGGGNPSGPGSPMESTTELSAFSAGPVDDSQFAIPAGFRKVEPAQRRGAR
jgi:hypothetical protein